MNPTIDPRRTSLHGPSFAGPSTLTHPPPPNPAPVKKKRPSHSALALADSPPADGSGPDLTKVRAYAACKSCRLKKIKCLPGPAVSLASRVGDASQPGTCQQCSLAGTECVYPPTRDRAAYSRQYVQNLETRVHALEAVHVRLMPMLEAFERGGGGLAPMKMEMDAQGAAGSGGYQNIQAGFPAPIAQASREHEIVVDNNDEDEGSNADGEGFGEEDTGQMTQDEHGNYRWIGSSNTLSLLDSFTPASPHPRPGPTAGQSQASGKGDNNNPYFAPVAGSGVIKVLPTVDEVMYPDIAAGAEMIDAYFREIHPILPIMMEKEFREAYAALMDRRARGLPETSGIFISVVFAMYALGERVLVTSRAWKREREKQKAADGTDGNKGDEGDGQTVLPGEAEAGVIWYERSQILRYTTITDISLHQVQSLLLMAAFQASVNAMPMSWLLCGIALRMAQDLGLHRSSARLKLSYAEKQVRSRCWWAAYGLDRMLSLTLGRPPGVEDLDIDVPYPAEMDEETIFTLSAEHSNAHSPLPAESLPTTMSGFAALTKLCKIAGKISHILYRPSHGRSSNDPAWLTSQQNSIDKLDKALRDWLEHDVPPKYKDPSQDPAIQLVSAALSNTYFACLITLHRNFLPPSADSSRPRPLPSSTSLSHCVAAARSVIHIAAQSRVLLPPSHHLAVFCQYLWSAAVMLLLCEVQAKDQVVVDAVGPQVDSCRRSLQALEPVWPGARKLKELLDEAERRGKEVLKSGMQQPSKKRRKSTHPEGSVQKRPSINPGGGKRQSSSTTIQTSPSRQSPSSWAIPQHSIRSPMPGQRPSQAYETSDTRTSIPDMGLMSASSNSGGNGMVYAQQSSVPYPSSTSTTTISPTDFLQPINYTFDVGGVDFDGLEMLHGFNNDFASIWSTLVSDPGVDMTSTNIAQQQTHPMRNPGRDDPTIAPLPTTVSSTPIASGPSPHGSQWLQSPQNNIGQGFDMQGQFGTLPDLGSSEFWSQVAAAGQDWGADPNVPFNF